MGPTPDYKAYTLAQLEDIERHINRERFPDRYEMVMAEIALKRSLLWSDDEDDAQGVDPTTRERGISAERRDIILRVIAIFELALGLVTVAWVVVMRGKLGQAGDPAFGLIVQLSRLAGLLLAVAGGLLLMKTRLGLYLSLLVQGAMFLGIVTDRPVYLLFSPLGCFIWLRAGTPVPHHSIGLNMTALAVIAILLWVWKERGAGGIGTPRYLA